MILTTQYCAGFFDGEGSVKVDRRLPVPGRNYAYYCVKVTVGNTNREVLEAFQETWGGPIHEYRTAKDHHKRFYSWRPGPRASIAFLKAVLPHLIVKRAVAEKALALYQTHKMGGRHRTRYLAEEMNRRNELYLDIRELNHRTNRPFLRESVAHMEAYEN